MFVDVAKIVIRAGDGGNGAVSFLREKYVASGGPDGGDGGRGGDVILQADTNLSTLVDFQYKRKFLAQNGKNGGEKNCSGRGGENLVIRVPLGTLIREEETGRVMADLSDLEPVVLARGGRGGWGNSHFATPTRQIPRFSKPGLPGEEFSVVLELKLLADVGLVGFPNVGKSTILSRVSNATPKIANYHFTTLSPMQGVVRISEGASFVMADIPGLIEGAAEGVGLGHEFLRHVERCRLILHVVDGSGLEGRDPLEDYQVINRELSNFNEELGGLPQVVVANKCDLLDEEGRAALMAQFSKVGVTLRLTSGATGEGLSDLSTVLYRELQKLPPPKRYQPEAAPVVVESGRKFTVEVQEDIYFVDAPWLAQVLGSVNMDDYESLQYFQRVLRESGIIDRLLELGVSDGDTVSILDFEFEYVS